MSFEKFLDKYMDTSGNYASASEIDIAEDAYNAGYAAALESVKSKEPAFKIGDKVKYCNGDGGESFIGTVVTEPAVKVRWPDSDCVYTEIESDLRKVSK